MLWAALERGSEAEKKEILEAVRDHSGKDPLKAMQKKRWSWIQDWGVMLAWFQTHKNL